MIQCLQCGSNKIHIKKRQLCNKCYGKFLYANKPLIKKDKYSNIKFMHRIIEKRGIDFFKDLQSLNYRPYYTLAAFARQYGFTRERARQYYTGVFNKPYKQIGLENLQKAKQEFSCPCEPEHKAANLKKGTPIQIAATIRVLFKQRCLQQNIQINPSCNQGHHFIINNKKILVRTSKPKLYQKCITPRYFYTLKKEDDYDILICYRKDKKDFFIIPKDKIIQTGCLSILDDNCKAKNAKNFYSEYKEAWNILK